MECHICVIVFQKSLLTLSCARMAKLNPCMSDVAMQVTELWDAGTYQDGAPTMDQASLKAMSARIRNAHTSNPEKSHVSYEEWSEREHQTALNVQQQQQQPQLQQSAGTAGGEGGSGSEVEVWGGRGEQDGGMARRAAARKARW